jgi:predicted helicase
MRERYNLPNDPTGIDGIYETHDGSHVAYQVKYRQKANLTFAEVAPFLGITEAFADRVIFTNASTLSNKAIVRTRWFSKDHFYGLSANSLSQIKAWLKEKPAPIVRATPDPKFQVQALTDIKDALNKHDRTTVVMACGTGKTLVSLWAAEQAKPKTVLVLVPSLTLLQQTLREWSEHTASWRIRVNLDRAIEIAVSAHKGQVDKSGAPYILHPLRIMFSLRTEEEKIVGVLHDVVEDSDWSFEDLIKEGFSNAVITGLRSVTEVEGEDYDAFILRACSDPIGRNVKIADVTDNLDIKRIDEPSQRDFERLKKYRRALKVLQT